MILGFLMLCLGLRQLRVMGRWVGLYVRDLVQPLTWQTDSVLTSGGLSWNSFSLFTDSVRDGLLVLFKSYTERKAR